MSRLMIGSPGVTIPPIRNAVEQARKNEQKGYDSMWWPDHVMGWIPDSIWTTDLFPVSAMMSSPHLFLEPTSTISAVAQSTHRLTLGTAVMDTIRRHPAVIAQTALTLDHITEGRFILGVGAGEGENLLPYGAPFDRPADRVEEAVKVIRLLWECRGKSVSFDGKYWKLNRATLYLPPYGESPPPVWIAGQAPKMLGITGRMADGWLPTLLSLEEYRKRWSIVEKASLASGRDPQKITHGMWTWLITDPDKAECEKLLDSAFARSIALLAPSEIYEEDGYEHPLGRGFYGLRDYIPNRLSRDEALAALRKVPREVCEKAVMFGSPDQIVKKLEAYEEAGLQHVVLWNATFFCDINKLSTSFHCMDEILNHFKSKEQQPTTISQADARSSTWRQQA